MSTLPSWMEEGWLSKNTHLTFVKRMRNTSSQIECDKAIKKPHQKPMGATRECLFGDESVEATCFQWNETKRELAIIPENEYSHASAALELFKTEYAEYIAVLEK